MRDVLWFWISKRELGVYFGNNKDFVFILLILRVRVEGGGGDDGFVVSIW